MIDLAIVTAPNPDIRALIGELEADLAQFYPPEQRHGLPISAIFQPHIRFFVAHHNNVPVGCGGVALFSDFAEVKRMYVRPAARGQGAAPAILAKLAATARDAGLPMLRLETGTEQHAAIKLYERAGFVRCTAFGDYATMPANAISTSVFMEKPLG